MESALKLYYAPKFTKAEQKRHKAELGAAHALWLRMGKRERERRWSHQHLEQKHERYRRYYYSDVDHTRGLKRAAARRYRVGREDELALRCLIWRQNNPDYVRAYSHNYRDAHLDELREKEKKYRESHREELCAKNKRQHRIYYITHRKEHLVKCADYYAAHREECRTRQAEYQKAHRAEANARNRAYRARKKAENQAQTA